MARRKSKRNARTYARPVVSGNQTMSFDLSQARFSTSVGDGVILTPNKIRALLGLNSETVDAIKITSIIFSPWVEHSRDSESATINRYTDVPWVVDFVDGQRFSIMDKMKPTKVTPSMLSPAGRWQDASSTSTQLVKIKGPYFVNSGTANPVSYFLGSVIVNVAVRTDQPTQTALAPA